LSVHGSPSLHEPGPELTGRCWHPVPVHVSWVQESPSSHEAAPVPGWQAPLTHTSPAVQGSPSSHTTPETGVVPAMQLE
jgi:hypothetical protein